jgi:hypothetical protein
MTKTDRKSKRLPTKPGLHIDVLPSLPDGHVRLSAVVPYAVAATVVAALEAAGETLAPA